MQEMGWGWRQKEGRKKTLLFLKKSPQTKISKLLNTAEISATLKDLKYFDSINSFSLLLITASFGPSFPISFFMFTIFSDLSPL